MKALGLGRGFFLAAIAVSTWNPPPAVSATGNTAARAEPPESGAEVIQSIEFTGLRRIRPAALRAYIHSVEGRPLNPVELEKDVRRLHALGWFEFVRVEAVAAENAEKELQVAGELPPHRSESNAVRVIFTVEERPFLSEVKFTGSQALSPERIENILVERQITLKKAAPLDRAELWRAAQAIRAELANLGHPWARVDIHLEETSVAAERAVFVIDDGSRASVSRVSFAGNQAFSEQQLRHVMRRVAPGAVFAGLRSKDIYTPERLNDDLTRVRAFYQSHGYAEMRVGAPSKGVRTERVLRWWPWPHHETRPRFHLSIPIQEGTLYKWGDVAVENETADHGFEEKPAGVATLAALREGKPYSAETLEAARLALQRACSPGSGRDSSRAIQVESLPQFDAQAGRVNVRLRVRESEPFVVRRIELRGQKRFSERYYRRHLQLEEGKPFDEARLSQGMAQLARTGYIRPVRKEDIHVRLDEIHHAADIATRFQEVGQQKISFGGGGSGLGNTLDLAYEVFGLLGREELLTGHLEGGPESLQVLLGIAKEGVFGTCSALAFTLFEDVIRPNLAGNPNGTGLFQSVRRGLGLAWGRPVGARNSFAVTYELSHSTTKYSVPLPSGITGLPNNQVRSNNATRSAGLNWATDTGRERFDSSASVSGGWLGGNNNDLHATLEYARLGHDPLSNGRNTWGFRTSFAGVSSYHGDLPYQERLFTSSNLVRGFRTGELAPYAVTESTDANGKNIFHAQSPGANLTGAANAEYRIPLFARTETAGFFDAGSARTLSNWLGPDRPNLLGGSNGVFRASTGLQLQWMVPGVRQPVRLYYAYNPLRLTRVFSLADGSLFRPNDRKTALGWAFGSLF
ncbi:MAG TPA: POTRA domain-containing protein [Candidatus Acidoferrales bacterium]|nr:POTRA domain-containing protein [Candidatus Acidoferrales bacterium]